MNWEDITVEQYQAMAAILQDKDLDDTDKEIRIMALLLGTSEEYIDNLISEDFKKLRKSILFIFSSPDDVKGKAKKIIKVDGKEFKVNYRVEKFRYAQYVEVMHFKEDIIQNLHMILASICEPVKNYYLFKKTIPNQSETHEQRSEVFKKAKFIDLYRACVFFYRVYLATIKTSRDYLVSEMIRKMDRTQAQTIVQSLIESMDGFITPKYSSDLKVTI